MQAIVGATIHTVCGETINEGVILISNDKIIDVGRYVPIPHDTPVLDASGKIITPGLIDCHTHLGIAEEAVGTSHIDKNEVSDPICPHLSVIDAINPDDEGLNDALCGGVTTIIVTPGSENVIGGQSAAIKTSGRIIDRMIILKVAGMKIAFGENPIKMYSAKDKAPFTPYGGSRNDQRKSCRRRRLRPR